MRPAVPRATARKLRAHIVLCVLAVLLAAPTSSPAQPPAIRGNVAFWLSVPDGANGVFDEQTIRMLAPRARLVVLNAPMEGPAPQYRYEAVVRRFHEARPDLPVLIYTWSTFLREGPRVGEATISGFSSLAPSALLEDRKGEALRRKVGGYVLGDPREKGYRDWHVERVAAMIKRTGANGVHLDGSHRTFPVIKRRTPREAEEYGRGMDALFTALKTRIGPAQLLTFNGLWTHSGADLADQQRLLDAADGAFVEFFGLPTTADGVRPFRENIAPFLKSMSSHPGKLILVVGRGSLAYSGYEEDYLWQRYVYAAYLMTAGPNTAFKYLSDFMSIPRSEKGRSGSLDVFADWDVDLGEPQGSYQERGGVFARRFAKGLVLMAPHDGGAGSYALPQSMFTPEGEELQGRVGLRPGQGLLLLDAPPKRRPSPIQIFRAQGPVPAPWRWAEAADVDGKRVLRLERTPEGSEWEHDLLLDGVRSLVPPTTVRMRVRARDAAAELRFVAEVDDRERKDFYVVVAVPADGKPRAPKSPASPFRVSWRGAWTAVSAGRSPWGGGTLQDVTVDGSEVLGRGGRYTFRRWSHVRVVGAVDIEEAELAAGPTKKP